VCAVMIVVIVASLPVFVDAVWISRDADGNLFDFVANVLDLTVAVRRIVDGRIGHQIHGIEQPISFAFLALLLLLFVLLCVLVLCSVVSLFGLRSSIRLCLCQVPLMVS